MVENQSGFDPMPPSVEESLKRIADAMDKQSQFPFILCGTSGAGKEVMIAAFPDNGTCRRMQRSFEHQYGNTYVKEVR